MRIAASFILLAALAGCGFEPLYGERSGGAPAVQGALESVLIEPIAERTGQRLYNFLRDRLNPHGKPARPLYVLSVKLEEIEEKLALAGDKTPTRTNLTLIARFALKDATRTEVLYEGRSRVVAGFDIISSLFSTHTAAEDARRRGALALSEDIRTKLALYLGHATAGAP